MSGCKNRPLRNLGTKLKLQGEIWIPSAPQKQIHSEPWWCRSSTMSMTATVKYSSSRNMRVIIHFLQPRSGMGILGWNCFLLYLIIISLKKGKVWTILICRYCITDVNSSTSLSCQQLMSNSMRENFRSNAFKLISINKDGKTQHAWAHGQTNENHINLKRRNTIIVLVHSSYQTPCTSCCVSEFTWFSQRMPRKYNSPPENCLPRQTFNVTSESSTWKPASPNIWLA